MPLPNPKTIQEQIAWSYANLARAHAALDDGETNYKRVHHIIRNRLYHGLLSGKLNMRSLYEDERLKMTTPQICSYCGKSDDLAVDHLIPRIKSGLDVADNLVWSCRACNSSKQGRDLLVWMKSKDHFPSLMLLRRYLKLVARYCEENGLMNTSLSRCDKLDIPFIPALLPTRFPPLTELRLMMGLRTETK